MKRFALAAAVVAAGAVAGTAKAGVDIGLGGTATTKLAEALNNLGISFTDYGADMPPAMSHNILVIGMDGGTSGFVDYHAHLAAGNHIILTGGSNFDGYRSWASEYFNIYDTGGGWHTDGDWHKASNHPVNQFLPDNYTFSEVGHTYHMLAIDGNTPDTVILGTNDEPVNVAAVRTFAGGGTFNYMALDLGIRDGDEPFIEAWLRGAIVGIPAPGALALFGLAGLAGSRRRRN